MRTITNSINIFLVVILIIYLVLISFLLFHHNRTLVISTDRMHPSIPQGSLLLFEEVDANNLRIGDIISFAVPDDSYSTDLAQEQSFEISRLFSIIETDEGLLFRTKSDAYDRLDFEFVKESDFHGRITFHIPYFGFLVNPSNQFISKMIILTPLIIILTILIFINRRILFRK